MIKKIFEKKCVFNLFITSSVNLKKCYYYYEKLNLFKILTQYQSMHVSFSKI